MPGCEVCVEALFMKVIRDIAEAYHELPTEPASMARKQFHASLGFALIDSAVDGDVERAVELVRTLYTYRCYAKKVFPSG
jgi:hypothetical protein